MTRRVVASAPGKLILMGEHAAVYGRPAVVAALDLRTRVEIEEIAHGVELDLVTLGHRETNDWAAIDAYTEGCARRWRRFDGKPTRQTFAELADRDRARVVKLALGEARRAASPPVDRGLRVRVTSEIPVGSGFGSSASVAVAVAGAWLAWGSEPGGSAAALAPDFVAGVALEVERRQHGRPSGVDHTTVLRGGILGFSSGDSRRVEPLAASRSALAGLRVFDTGRPAQTTGEVVAAVRALADRDREGFTRRLDAMEAATRDFTGALAAGDRADDRGDLLAPIRAFERRLEEVGVVPPAVAAAVRQVERRGGAGKVSGAGALAGDHAGALLVCWPAGLDGKPEEALPGYSCQRAAIGAVGLRIEEAS